MEVFDEGDWPTNPYGTGYTDDGIANSSINPYASYETPLCVAVEVLTRLEHCEHDGVMLRAYYSDGLPISRIARLARMDEGRAERNIRRALNYISSGPWRRWQDNHKRKGISYKEWCNHRWCNKRKSTGSHA